MSCETTADRTQALVQAYLCFDGRTEEALEFYKKALGAEVEMLMRFSESPEPSEPGMVPPGSENKIMHGQFRVGQTTVMASDGPCEGKMKFEGINLALTAPSVADAERYFAALTDGGKVEMPLTKTFFSEKFGMVQDRFGVLWMVLVSG